MTRKSKPLRPASAIALQAEQRLHRALIRIGSDDVHYMRAFRTGKGRELALNRVNAGIDVWTEAVWEQAPPAFKAMRKKRYPPAAPRISTLKANAPHLYTGSAADYWRFPTLSDLDAFAEWYKTL